MEQLTYREKTEIELEKLGDLKPENFPSGNDFIVYCIGKGLILALLSVAETIWDSK
jgi:hypothetical protein